MSSIPARVMAVEQNDTNPGIGRVIPNAALLHYFFQLPIADGIRPIPTHATQDDVPLEIAAIEIYGRRFAD